MTAIKYIAIMALVTYAIRIFPLILMKDREIKSKFIRRFLDFTPYAVLGSMTFPFIIYSTGNTATGIIGTAAALALSYLNKGLTKVAIYTVIIVYIADTALYLMK